MIINGSVGVLPCDTIYGLVASARNVKAAEKILSIKGRNKKPGTLVAASIEQLIGLGLKKKYLKSVEQFWPGAVSVVLPVPIGLDYLHAGRLSLPVRVTGHREFIRLLEATGPLITTSANLPDKKPAETVEEAYKYFDDDIDFYVDGGWISFGPPSTIIRVVDDAIEVLREGAVKIDEETGRIN